jgi:hypothetical protein
MELISNYPKNGYIERLQYVKNFFKFLKTTDHASIKVDTFNNSNDTIRI